MTIDSTEKSKSSTLLSDRLRNTGKILRESAEQQIMDHNNRFQTINKFYENLFRDLLVQSFDKKQALRTAQAMFGSNEFNFVAVDGTEYSKPIFDMVAFFGGSYACEGSVTLSEEGVKVSYKDGQFLKEGIGISSCAPVYVDKIPEIDHAFKDISQPGEANLRKQLAEDTVINNSSISDWIMTFSEFYLAYKFAVDDSRNVKLILLDRNLAAMLGSVLYDTSKKALWKTGSAIHGLEIDGKTIDDNELAYGRQRLSNPILDIPSPRGDYLRYRLIQIVEEKGPLTKEDIFSSLGLGQEDEKRMARASRYLNRSVREGYLVNDGEKYSINKKYEGMWPRLRKATERIGKQLFEGSEKTNPLQITKDGKEEWLTTLDLGFLTLFCAYMLVEESWKRKILLIGMTKDTTAKDFKTHLLPVCKGNEIIPNGVDQLQLDAVPSTDRMILQSVSLFNSDKVIVPWSLVEYDSAFIMIVPDFGKRRGFVSGAVKNKITQTKLFLKSYVQLDQARSDSLLRSNVLCVDRPVYPEFDLRAENFVTFKHDYGSCTEPIEAIFYRNNKMANEIQNLSMVVLSAMGSSSIPEAFGHNRPLYIADKIAKWHCEEFRRMVDSTGLWITSNPRLRKFVFYMSTFRQKRNETENNRRQGV